MPDTVPAGPGWTCFRCDETFATRREAEDHFGFAEFEDSDEHNPACVERLNFSEKALRAGLMEMLRELEGERELNARLYERLETAEAIADSANSVGRYELGLMGGAKTLQEAAHNFDSIEGRALAAEAIVSEVEKVDPAVVARARAIVCGDPVPT